MGFNFTRMGIEKFSNSLKGLKITINLDILEIEQAKADILKLKEDLLSVKFRYAINYEENIAKVEFEGNILLSLDSKKAKTVLKDWEGKKLVEEVKTPLLNLILRKANIKAIQLEEEVGLPTHFNLPTISSTKKEEN